MTPTTIHPFIRFWRLLRVEKGDLWTILVYTAIIGILSLAMPLATQALVNTIASGFLIQPIFTLTLMAGAALLGAGLLQIGQLGVVERLQQRVFAVTSLKMARRLTTVKLNALQGTYTPELVNRFFDVLTIQKSLAKLLLDGYTSLLTALVGMLILGFYSPLLLLLDFVILFALVLLTVGLGWNGLRTSIYESKKKYAVADWLEDLARCGRSLKMHGDKFWLVRRADKLSADYLDARESHFRVYRRQAAGVVLFDAFATASVLAMGGWLVINGQLTLGQLVAAQIVVASVLKSVEKLVMQSDQFFDLLTGLDKVGHVTDLDEERQGGIELADPQDGKGIQLDLRGVRFSYDGGKNFILDGVTMTIQPGENVSLVGKSGAGKSTLVSLVCGLEEASHGTILIDNVEIREIDLDSLRQHIALVGYENELFDGTIEENIVCGRSWITREDLRWALDVAHLTEDLDLLPAGTATTVVSGGVNLSRGQVQRILIARAVAGRPRLLILDEAITGIDENVTELILDDLFDPNHGWSILDISHMSDVVMRSDRILLLQGGKIEDCGSPRDFSKKMNPGFSDLFPILARQIREDWVRWREMLDKRQNNRGGKKS
ncbi:MAG: ATP-binding cassette domain-containing protein [Armatimonadetes bacterium]|nr:ATP-binding cassette domain-containing protein [Armatimonadota bacterium]